jgi:hypothetical protein
MSSSLLLDECFETQGPGFVDLVRSCSDDRHLAGLADRMLVDPRPWVREQILAYLDTPFDRPGHHPLVKRLFKHAEARGDLDILSRCLVGFDRGVRRQLTRSQRYDWQTRTYSEIETLALPRLGLQPKHRAKHPKAPALHHVRERPGMPLFSLATRLHLRRRAWRFYRHLGFQKPNQYVAAISQALARFVDRDLAKGHDVLECWGLVHALFGESPTLVFKGTWIGIAEEKTLAELTPAPAFSALWTAPAAVPHVLTLAVQARSKLVRTWAQDWIKEHHPTALRSMSLAEVRKLLDAEWEDVRLVGLGLFAQHPDVPTLTVRAWMELLSVADEAALAQIVDAMQTHVRGSRLNHVDAVTMACHRSVAVVRMAMAFMADKVWDSPAETDALLGLRQASCAALATDLGRFLLERLASPQRYHINHVFVALDHRLEGMRAAAMTWIDEHRHVREDSSVWARAAESPYDQVRCWLLRSLERFAGEARIAGDQHRLLWTTVLLGVHRGGREKQAALRQLTQAIVLNPERSAELLPLLSAALRSLRLPERRAACASIVTVMVRRPELKDQIAVLLPELDCSQILLEIG